MKRIKARQSASSGVIANLTSSGPRAPSLLGCRPRWRILLRRRRQRLAHRLRPDLGADRSKGLDAWRQEIAIAINEAVQLPEQGCGFLVGKVKVHDPDVGSLTTGREPLG